MTDETTQLDRRDKNYILVPLEIRTLRTPLVLNASLHIGTLRYQRKSQRETSMAKLVFNLIVASGGIAYINHSECSAFMPLHNIADIAIPTASLETLMGILD